MRALDNGQGLGRGLFSKGPGLIEPGDFISFYGTCKHQTPGFAMDVCNIVLWGNPKARRGQLAQLANYAPPSSELCNALFVKVANRKLYKPDGSFKIALIAIRRIESGDEICAYYGYDPMA